MNKFAVTLLFWSLHNAAFAGHQNGASNNTLLSSSETLAAEMGKTYQLAQNCKLDMNNISAPRASMLFRNYYAEDEVKIIMKQYVNYAAQEKGKLCNREIIKFHILMNKMAIYIRASRPLSQ